LEHSAVVVSITVYSDSDEYFMILVNFVQLIVNTIIVRVIVSLTTF